MDGMDDQASLNRDSGPPGEANTLHRTAPSPVPPRNFCERGFGVLAVAAAGVRAPLPHTERSWLGTHVASFQY